MRHMCTMLLLSLLCVACGGDGSISAPEQDRGAQGPMLATGTDPITGATIVTDKDDYAPGEIVHLTGSAWAPGETVHLVMTEMPDTHADVVQDVTADSAGGFSLHFYDVQTHDLGVTFTLTATGGTSGSSATVVFFDGNLQLVPNPTPSPFSPNADGINDLLTIAYRSTSTATTNVFISIRPLGAGTGGPATFSFTVGTVNQSPGGNGTVSWNGLNTASSPAAEGVYSVRLFSTNSTFGQPESSATGQRLESVTLDRTAPVVTNVTPAPAAVVVGTATPVTVTALATDALSNIASATLQVDALAPVAMAAVDGGFNETSEDVTATIPGATIAGLAPGPHFLCVRAADVAGTTSAPVCVVLTISPPPNQTPLANAQGPYSGNEGSAIPIAGTGSDPDGGAVTFAWTYAPNDGSCTFASAAAASTTVTCNDNTALPRTLTLTVTDNETTTATSTASLTVSNVAPTATFNAPASVGAGTSINLSLTSPADASSADVAAGFTYAFDCGDGAGYGAYSATSTAACPTSAAGGRTVKGKIKDKDGGEREYTASVTINTVAPLANAAGPYNGNEGSPINIAGTGSDPDGGTVTFEWSVAPTNCTFGNLSAASTTVTCTDNGAFTLTLKVTDDETTFTTATASLTVANVAPTIIAYTLGTSVNEGSSIPFQIAPVSDPSSVDVAAGFTYSFACDGSTFGNFLSSNMVNCPAGDGPGSVTIAGKVKDKDGGLSSTVSSVFPVVNVAPTATFGNDGPVDEGTSFHLSLTSPLDPSAADVSAGFTYAFDCGSGTGYEPYSAANTATCVTNDNGTRAVKGKIKDKDGGYTETTASVTVNNVAPTATFNSPAAAINEGASFNLSLTSPFDPSSVDVTAGFTYSFDCGTGYGAPGASSSVSCATLDNGPLTVKGKIADKNGGATEYTATVTVNNVAPTATFANNGPVNEGSPFQLTLSNPQDVAADIPGLTYAFDCGAGYAVFSPISAATCPTTDNGTPSVKGKIRDKDGGESEYTGTVTVNNVAPTATFGNDGPVNEGTPFHLDLTNPQDVAADIPGLTYAFDCGSGYGVFGATSTATCPTTDNGTPSVKGKVKDKDGGVTEYTATVTVNNVAPDIIVPLNIPLNPIAAGTPVNLTWTFTDPGADNWTCKISWDQPVAYEPSFSTSPGVRSCTASKVLSAGVYTVTVYVDDGDGGSDTETATAYIVVYDPNGGFVTGGGWITSPLGAYVADPALTGKATFGFVSKYQKGATVPTGNTEFQFHAGNLNFKSTVYQWLVIAGARAQYKGEGTINGAGRYGFLLTGIDGQVSGGGGVDKFRIKIWDFVTNAVVYDNQPGALDDSPNATTLGGGSIVIHTK